MGYMPTLCLDFDGVIHSYSSGWVEADFIPDPPVPGAFEFILKSMDSFIVVIYSSRSHQPGGIRAMQNWLKYWVRKSELAKEDQNKILNRFNRGPKVELEFQLSLDNPWPIDKPAAFVTLDDRAVTFRGEWPEVSELLNFKPWNK